MIHDRPDAALHLAGGIVLMSINSPAPTLARRQAQRHDVDGREGRAVPAVPLKRVFGAYLPSIACVMVDGAPNMG